MKLPLLTASLFCLTTAAHACDLCACALPSIRLEPRAGWHAGFAEQFTDYGRLQDSGRGISNPAGQYMHSSITQLYAGYDFAPTFGVQLNVPYIARTFRRVENGTIENGTESGFGDISLIGSWTALRVERGDFLLTVRVNAGIKLPTGDSSRVREEGEHEHEHEEAAKVFVPEVSVNVTRKVKTGTFVGPVNGSFVPVFRTETQKVIVTPAHFEEEEHHEEEEPSGVHGHDLALGTGSLDGVFGADVSCQWKRAFFEAGLQYTLRGDGLHSYDFADDLLWHAGGGFVVLQSEGWNAALGVRFSGETKSEDEFRGARLDDTAITTVFVGPRLAVTAGERMSANVGIDFPIRRDNSGVQTVPDYRVQGGVSWQF